MAVSRRELLEVTAYAVGFFIAMSIIVMVIGSLANVHMEGTSKGSGTSDFDLVGTGQSARMAAYQSSGVDEKYEYTQVQGTQYTDSSSDLDVSIDIDNAGGTRKTMFVYKQKNKAASQTLRINNIVGTFTAETSGNLVVASDGSLSYDLDYTFAGRNLTYTAQAVIMDASTGRPATSVRVDRAGNWTIWDHLNVTTPITTPESWLGSCEDMNNDIINDESIPDSIFVMPKNDSKYNYWAVGRKIHKELNSTE